MNDDDRPPVLAHQRFSAERGRFDGMDLAQRFALIHERNLWGADTSVSGLGSEAGATDLLGRTLPRVLREMGVTALLDAPCGDAGWIARSDMTGIRYTGVDIVPELIAALTAKRKALGDFVTADITRDPLPVADAVLCRDCLVHLSFANIARALRNFRRSGAQWLVTTTFPDWQRNMDCKDGDWRALNFEKPPFAWPAPDRLLNEGCEEAGGGWRDKSLGIWRFERLPGS